MVLNWWWLALLVAAAVAAYTWWVLRSPEHREDHLALTSHIDFLRRSPRFRALVRADRLVRVVTAVGVALLLAAALLTVGRLGRTTIDDPSTQSRDIMLCLDVSSSMTEADRAVVAAYADIATKLSTERIGLTLWSGAAVPAFPLTDDHVFVQEQLERATQAFEVRDWDYIAGTVLLSRQASSLIGDGLVSCLQRFDRPQQQRSRVVVLASDNDIQGPPIFTLTQAAERAARAKVVVHCIAPDTSTGKNLAELRAACESTGGTMTLLDDERSADEIVQRIEQLTRSRTAGTPRVLVLDRPGAAVALGSIGLLLLLGAPPLVRRWLR